MRVIALLALCLAAAAAVPASPERIVGGSLTTIDRYPTMAALLSSADLVYYRQSCGGTILNNRSILSAAHCTWGVAMNRFRFRVGSTWANSGGIVHIVQSIVEHPNFTPWNLDMDLVILRSSTAISHNSNVQPALIAGPNYFLADNQVVWAAGWGLTSDGGSPSEQLRHVQVYSINNAFCRSRYGFLTDNMFCAGVQNVGGRDTCQQDSGGPLFHNGVVVGVTFYGNGCARPEFPGVYVFLPRASLWIGQNA